MREDESPAAVAAHADAHFDDTVEKLCDYLRIPAISCESEHRSDVEKLARGIRDDLRAAGLKDAEVRELEGALPIVTASRRSPHDDRPTVLIYGHMDLQPVRGEPWSSPPHEPERRGDRLYARGAADDMGGWISHLAAIRSYLAVTGELPVHLKLVIEGEEEIGSPNLERYMDAHPEAFAADVMVLTDCENPSTDLPGLTVSLRGLYEVEVICEALYSDVHSGLWGNVAPDPATALIVLLSRLFDEAGRLRLGRRAWPESFHEAAASVPLDEETIRAGAHLLEGVSPLPDEGRSPAEWMWRQPAATILSTTLPRAGEEKNAIRGRASAVLSIRLAPGQTHQEMRGWLEETLLDSPPGGVRVRLADRPGRAESWLYEPKGKAFEAADRAYRKAWGHALLPVGVGGSIPFVALFGRRFGDLPLILNGVMDPETGAHGPDESLHLGVFRKAIAANVHLLWELGAEPALRR